ncbi:MAG: GTPase HflX [Pirellulales bacterium]
MLVGVVLTDRSDGSRPTQDDPLDELAGLAESAGAVVAGRMLQRRATPDVTYYLGKGKVEELREMVVGEEADVALFDNDLSPGQKRNLEKELKVKVLDRTELILDIFATRARTHEARLAVELAQLEYALPRLKRMWTHLSRIKKGIGMRGPGEKQIEEDRRIVERRIRDLREELHTIERRRERQVASRHDRLTISLVGYTNAGKSTLLNKLTGSDVLAEDRLFATLDTRTRRWQLPGWGPVLLSDTVGFIRDLPHELIASFKATLEETRQADLLLHVADASSPEVFAQISSVYSVLEELHVEAKRTLLVLNKADMLADEGAIHRLLDRYPNAVAISAKSGFGLDRLAAMVSAALTDGFLDLDIETGVDNGKLLAYLASHGEIRSKRFGDERVLIHCRLPAEHFGRMDKTGAVIRPHANGTPGNGQATATTELPAQQAVDAS